MAEYRYELFADYHQFYLQDDNIEVGDLSESWTQKTTNAMLAVAPHVIGVGTARNMTVPVTVETRDAPPDDSDFAEWDLVNECSLQIETGRIVVAGCTDFWDDAARIGVTPGHYRARIYYGDLDTLSEDGLEGKDHYKVNLWPGEETEPITLLDRRKFNDANSGRGV